VRSSGNDIYRFGPFELDSNRRRLIRDGEPILISDRYVEILLLFAANAGRVISKDELIEAGWQDVAVADNSIEQAISSLRKTLGTQPDGGSYIETLTRRGYRFGARVERGKAKESDASLDALLAPYRAFVEGRAALETLGRRSSHARPRCLRDALRAERIIQPRISGWPTRASSHLKRRGRMRCRTPRPWSRPRVMHGKGAGSTHRPEKPGARLHLCCIDAAMRRKR
jgi:DNA-binding winged helix-turn-helix (wHTH) protein